jgi:hypothetical protein
MGTLEKISAPGAAGSKAKPAAQAARRQVTPSPPVPPEKLWIVGGFAMSRKLALQIAACARQRPKADPGQS